MEVWDNSNANYREYIINRFWKVVGDGVTTKLAHDKTFTIDPFSMSYIFK